MLFLGFSNKRSKSEIPTIEIGFVAVHGGVGLPAPHFSQHRHRRHSKSMPRPPPGVANSYGGQKYWSWREKNMSRIAFSACACRSEKSIHGVGTRAFRFLAQLSKFAIWCQKDRNAYSQAKLKMEPGKEDQRTAREKRRKMENLDAGIVCYM